MWGLQRGRRVPPWREEIGLLSGVLWLRVDLDLAQVSDLQANRAQDCGNALGSVGTPLPAVEKDADRLERRFIQISSSLIRHS